MTKPALVPCAGPAVGFVCTALVPRGAFFCEPCFAAWDERCERMVRERREREEAA